MACGRVKRDSYVCQKCRKEINIIAEHFDPSKIAMETLSEIKEFKIYLWKQTCWKCMKITPVATYNFIDGFFNRHIGSIEKIDKCLMKKYPYVRKTYSKTLDEEVIANTCINCGALQGNYYIGEALLEIELNDKNMEELVDSTIPNRLQYEDLGFEEENENLSGWVCFKDGNVNNKNDENLFLLCTTCKINEFLYSGTLRLMVPGYA